MDEKLGGEERDIFPPIFDQHPGKGQNAFKVERRRAVISS